MFIGRITHVMGASAHHFYYSKMVEKVEKARKTIDTKNTSAIIIT